MKTTSHPGSIASNRNLTASRRRRLMRLRSTALPIRLLTENAKRQYGNSFRNTQITNSRLLADAPSRRISWIRSFCRMRYRFFTYLMDLRGVNCTANCARPRRRRRLSTLRPPGELMRFRKPCVLSRLRTFGCHVRFVAMPISFVSYADRSLERSDLVSNGHYTWLQSGLSNLSGISGRFKNHFLRGVCPILKPALHRHTSGE